MSKVFNSRRELFICLFLIIITASVFWQLKDHEFIPFDDPSYITDNIHVRGGLTPENIFWAFTSFHANNWHPLTWISHTLDCHLFGLKSGPHHLMNVFFHIANAVLLFLIFNRMTRAPWQSAFIAAIFALHPLHVESVAWASERKDVLSTFFLMLTLGAYVLYVERPGLNRYLFIIIFFIFGLMSKPMLVTTPFVLLLLDYWPLKRFQTEAPDVNERLKAFQPGGSKKKKLRTAKSATKTENLRTNRPVRAVFRWSLIYPLIREKIPLFLLSILSCIITVHAQQNIIKSMDIYPLSMRVANALISYLNYIGKMVWPQNLAIFYPYPLTVPSWQIAGAILLLLTVSITVLLIERRAPYLIMGWLWFLGILVPVIGLVQVGLQVMADRYMYAPLIGLLVIVAWGTNDLLSTKKYKHQMLCILSAVVISILTIMTFIQVGYWRNAISLYKHATEVTTNNDWAHYNLGLALMKKGDFDEAMFHFQETIRIAPNNHETLNNMGIILAKRGNLEGAKTYYFKALQIKPNYSEAYNNLGLALIQEGKVDEAISQFQKASYMVPDNAGIHFNLGRAFAKKGNLDGALDEYNEALRLKPDYAEVHNSIGIIMARKKNIDMAISHFQKALWINPNYREAGYNLKTAMTQKRGK